MWKEGKLHNKTYDIKLQICLCDLEITLLYFGYIYFKSWNILYVTCTYPES